MRGCYINDYEDKQSSVDDDGGSGANGNVDGRGENGGYIDERLNSRGSDDGGED